MSSLNKKEADEFPFDYMPPAQFHETFPALHRNEDSLRWELRHRNGNDLMKDEVVLERFADPQACRGSLLISPSRYFAWLRRRSRRYTAA
jgi:hypothetical protein